jgi:leucyl-tRNA synthetase
LEGLDWPESIKESQRNWIGRSEGAEFEFPLFNVPGQEDGVRKLKVFTTRPDTLFGATFVAISAELAQKRMNDKWKPDSGIKEFIEETLKEEATRPVNEVPEKKGIFTGLYAQNPANGEKIPVWITNYVLSGYGTGAIMAVPAHDERDFEFAKKYELPIKFIIEPPATTDGSNRSKAYSGVGVLQESGTYTGMNSWDVLPKITEAFGKKSVKYKIKDWVFSRQRYWGEPIPLIHCEKCGVVAVPEKDLPVKLPDVSHYEPTGTGESPLANIADWVNVTCPQCGGKGKRETNTMPQWAGSCWYYLRFIDPHNDNAFVDKKKEKEWMPVDMYVGGTEHATRHLIYARFWHKFLFDIGAVSTKEPFMKLKNQGLIMGTDGRKMSKRFGNVINPDDIVRDFGADTLRVYEMFMGPFEGSISWSTDNLVGSRRFVERVWRYAEKVSSNGTHDEVLLNQTIKQVTHDIENFGFNTVVSDLMKLGNSFEKEESISLSAFAIYLQLLAPVAPHIAEELWATLGLKGSVHTEKWPSYDSAKLLTDSVVVAIQVNGKVRGELSVSRALSQKEVETQARALPTVLKWIGDSEVKKTIYVKDRLVNFVL